MPWFLGNYTTNPEGRIMLIYNITPPQNVIENYDFVIEKEEKPYKQSLKGKSALLYGNTDTNEVWLEYEDRELTPEEQVEKKVGIIAQISTRDKVKADELSDEDLIILAEMYPDWEVGVNYKLGDVISYHNELYEILQDHTSQADWQPDSTASLYLNKMPSGVIPEWSQPAGAHDAYSMDDIVLHNDQTWISDIDANTYEPGVYGWSIYEGE